jgi:UDP-N-acetylglucosamine 2-epimerase (non-hydrolysing)
MRQIFKAVSEIVNLFPDVQFVYPVHKNPAVYKCAFDLLGDHPRIHLIDPIDVVDMYNLMSKSYLILTDSGGIQEEAPSLGKPILVLRTTTERPEAVEAGVAKVVGVETRDIIEEASLLLNNETEYNRMSQAINPYGDGHASERISEAILSYFKNLNKDVN